MHIYEATIFIANKRFTEAVFYVTSNYFVNREDKLKLSHTLSNSLSHQPR